ncbi:MAG: flagellar basal body-associated FliL family protein [Oscillospiraceae bacterium]|jgi:flagellar basal body-associated protein FliL
MKKSLIFVLAVLIIAACLSGCSLFGKKGKEGEEKIELTAYVPGDYFVTNVKGSSKLFKTTVVLMLDTDKLADELGDSEYVIRDTIIKRLRELTEEDLKSDGIQDRLRGELAKELNLALGIENIVTVYFSDFVMQ